MLFHHVRLLTNPKIAKHRHPEWRVLVNEAVFKYPQKRATF